MANIIKSAGLVLILSVLIIGCERPAKRTDVDIPVDASAQRKTELLNKIEKKYNNPEIHYGLGKVYYNDGLFDKAQWEFNLTLRFAPVHWPAEAAIVKTLMAAGKDAEAKLSAERALNRAAASAEDSMLLGYAYQRESLDEYALECYRQAQGLAPDSAALHKQIGYYYLSKREMGRAEEHLRRSFELDPLQSEIAYELGRMGVVVQTPRKRTVNTGKLDKILDEQKKKNDSLNE